MGNLLLKPVTSRSGVIGNVRQPESQLQMARIRFSVRALLVLTCAVAAAAAIGRFCRSNYVRTHFYSLDDALVRVNSGKRLRTPITKEFVLQAIESSLARASAAAVRPPDADMRLNRICEQIVRTHKMPNHCGFELRDGQLSLYAARNPDRFGHKTYLTNRIWLANVSNFVVLPRSHAKLDSFPTAL